MEYIAKNKIILIVVSALLLGGIVYFAWPEYSNNNGAGNDGAGLACTQEAKLCSDGSSVGRTGQNCDFAACPGDSTVPKGVLSVCPEQWIDDQMPRVISNEQNPKSQSPREYFIYQGVRRELAEFNLDWVHANCKLEKTIAY